jgi:chitin disaccharide deacetylase
VKLVLNADDFGLSPDTVRATVDCFSTGSLTSATIMPTAPASAAAIDFARQHPEYSFGVHLTFVGDDHQRPVSRPTSVPTLVDRHGTLRRTNAVRVRALLGRLSIEEIESEILAQVDRVRSDGVKLTHVDSHCHLHKFAPFRQALERALPQLGICRVRNAQDIYLRRRLASPTFWLGARWRRALALKFTTTDHFYMPAGDSDASWDELLGRPLLGSTLEIGVHPGYEESWRSFERQAIQAFAREAVARGHQLVGWRDVA